MNAIRLKIKVTKDVIKRAMGCGTNSGEVEKNCAIALSVIDLFPSFCVASNEIWHFDGMIYKTVCRLPEPAFWFIHEFDSLVLHPEKRLEIDPIEFEVDIPEKYFPDISEIHRILANCQTMELV